MVVQLLAFFIVFLTYCSLPDIHFVVLLPQLNVDKFREKPPYIYFYLF
jgi:hypothetical protein